MRFGEICKLTWADLDFERGFIHCRDPKEKREKALPMEDKKGKGLGPTPELAALQGLRLAFLSESGRSDHFDVSRLKWLTGGDTLVARGLFAKPVSFEPTHTIFIATNHLARIGIDEDAMAASFSCSPCRDRTRTLRGDWAWSTGRSSNSPQRQKGGYVTRSGTTWTHVSSGT